MKYCQIINNSKYKQAIRIISENEKGRKFCIHDYGHFIDVARICYILCLENNINVQKDVIYAAALLHDIGRSIKGGDHAQNGVLLAFDILNECGYDKDDVELITEVIRSHGHVSDDIKTFGDALARADKYSRRCYLCEAYDECYWSEDIKNKYPVY